MSLRHPFCLPPAISVLAVATLALAAPASAQTAAPVELELAPWATFDAAPHPYRYLIHARPRAGAPVELAADRRLLVFTITEPRVGRRRGRRHTCRHPSAPRAPSRARIRTLDPSASPEEGGAWWEWVDLRMYCSGRALTALRAGADVEGYLGYRRRSRRLWVARRLGASSRDHVSRLPLPGFRFELPEDAPTGTTMRGPEGERVPGPLVLSLRDRRASQGRSLTLSARVRARSGRERVYVRPDSWSFRVSRPDGTTRRCGLPPGGGTPPPDLYRRITTRHGPSHALLARELCPQDTFEHAGVYEVIPKLRLVHGGEDYELHALTGRFSGAPAVVRITGGRGGYVEQTPEPSEVPEAPETP